MNGVIVMVEYRYGVFIKGGSDKRYDPSLQSGKSTIDEPTFLNQEPLHWDCQRSAYHVVHCTLLVVHCNCSVSYTVQFTV